MASQVRRSIANPACITATRKLGRPLLGRLTPVAEICYALHYPSFRPALSWSINVPGVYISYPFCAQKCTYCNFASGVFPRDLEVRYRSEEHTSELQSLRHLV